MLAVIINGVREGVALDDTFVDAINWTLSNAHSDTFDSAAAKGKTKVDLEGARELLYTILSQTPFERFEEPPGQPPSHPVPFAPPTGKYVVTGPPPPEIDLDGFSDEAVQHAYRMLIGHAWFELRQSELPDKIFARGMPHWRKAVQAAPLVPLLDLFKPFDSTFPFMFASMMQGEAAATRKRTRDAVADGGTAIATANRHRQRCTGLAGLWEHAPMDRLLPHVSCPEAFQLAHSITAAASGLHAPEIEFGVSIAIAEDNIICKRASGRSMPVANDDLREQEERLGLWGSAKSSQGYRGPSFARKAILEQALQDKAKVKEQRSISATGEPAASASAAVASDCKPDVVVSAVHNDDDVNDDIVKHVSLGTVGFYAREVSRIEVVLERKEQPQVPAQEAGRDSFPAGLLGDEQVQALADLCPWLRHSDDSIVVHQRLYALLTGRVLGTLLESPGASLDSVHATLPLLSRTQTRWLLKDLEKRRLIRRETVPSIVCGGFCGARKAQAEETAFFLVLGFTPQGGEGSVSDST